MPQLSDDGLWNVCTSVDTLIARFMGPTWGHLGLTGPRWVPCWPMSSAMWVYMYNACEKVAKWHGATKKIRLGLKYISNRCKINMPSPVQTHWKYSGPQLTVQFSKALTKICFFVSRLISPGGGNIFNNTPEKTISIPEIPEIVKEVAADFWINKFAHFSETPTTQQQQQ